MSKLGIVGNVYCIEMVDMDDKLFSVEYFVALTTKSAIDKAKDWAEREHPDRKDVGIDGARCVIRRVIQ